MPKLIHRVTTIVRHVSDVTQAVRIFELADPEDWALPPFTAGAHIDVYLPCGAVRQYSLYGDPADGHRYRIAVRREDSGRGGSLSLHRNIGEGAILPVSLPRNHFPLLDGPHHVFIAGGIGITPILSMIQVLARTNGSFELHYCSRTPEATAFLRELAPLAERGIVKHYFSRTAQPARLDLGGLLTHVRSDARIYCCGPSGLIEAVTIAGIAAFADRIHVEFFGAASNSGQAAYEVQLARSGRVIPVAKDDTMLNALREAGVDVPSSCEGGVCLECKTRFLDGAPVHRDLVMSPADRREYVTPCVSGCAGARLLLDL
jgi:vanillate O-demethylase ferredoxin subunit